jgi:pimeloyl-ACP methyl ester carboxylesterase
VTFFAPKIHLPVFGSWLRIISTVAGFLLTSFLFLSGEVFALTEVTEDITADTTWTEDGSPYVIPAWDSIDVAAGVTLTISPGAIVKFSDYSGLNVSGKLIVRGEADKKVYLTSFYDDSLGGDTNGDGAATEPTPYEGWGINFSAGSGPHELSFFTARYSGSGLWFVQSDATLRNGRIEHSDETIGEMASVITLHDIFIDDYGQGINGYGGTLTIASTTIARAYEDNGDAIGLYDGATAEIQHSLITDVLNGSALGLYGSTARVSNTIFDGGLDEGIELYRIRWPVATSSTLYLASSTISRFPSTGLDMYRSNATVVESTIKENGYGIDFYGGALAVSRSAIYDNSEYGLYNEMDDESLDARNNWWGDSSGPLNGDSNRDGAGNEVYGPVTFSPWLSYDPTKKPDPVIIIPGIMGTALLKNYGDGGEIWPNANKLIWSLSDDFLNDLALLPDATERPDFPVTVGELLRQVTGSLAGISRTSRIFDGLIAALQDDGYAEGQTLFFFPYDWRFGSVHNAALLKAKIDEVVRETGSGKVDLVAHSMGGLVAKEYLAENGSSAVDQLIFIGTPQLGAPKAFKTLMYGDDMGIKIGFLSLLNPERIKFISQNMPSVYELLPSKKYITENSGGYVRDLVTASSTHSAFFLSAPETKDFMIRQGRNAALLPTAEELHERLDNLDLSAVRAYALVGYGSPTIGTITAKKRKSWSLFGGVKIVDDFVLGYVGGDETVPTLSAEDGAGKKFYFKKAVHSELPSVPAVPEKVLAILRESPATLPPPEIPEATLSATTTRRISGLTVSIHATTTVHIYDDKDNHTGPTDDGEIERNIPGIAYDRIGGQTFNFLPFSQGGVYRVVVTPQEIGSYDFYIASQNENGSTTAEYYWSEVPLSTLETKTEVLINLASSTEALGTEASSTDYAIAISDAADGSSPSLIPPSATLTATSSADLIPPQTVSVVATGTVSFIATDDAAGVLKTEYSTDGGVTWSVYKEPVEAPGKTVAYFSVDRAGNAESIQEVIVPEQISVAATTTPSTAEAPVEAKRVEDKPIPGGGPIFNFQQSPNPAVSTPPPPVSAPGVAVLSVASSPNVEPAASSPVLALASETPPPRGVLGAVPPVPVSSSATAQLESPISSADASVNNNTAAAAHSGATPQEVVVLITTSGAIGSALFFGLKAINGLK